MAAECNFLCDCSILGKLHNLKIEIELTVSSKMAQFLRKTVWG